MKTWIKWSLVGVPAAVLGMLLNASGPLGKLIWPLPADATAPTGAQLPLLVGLDILQALAFGFGAAFLVFGYPLIRGLGYGGAAYSRLVYVCVAWGLVSWVPHVAMHVSLGNVTTTAQLWRVVGIDYGFHLTALVSAAVFAHFFLRVARSRGTPTGTASARPLAAARAPPPGARAVAVSSRGRAR